MRIEYKYISNISIEDFNKNNVLPFYNENNNPCVLIKNSKNKEILSTGSTDNLLYHLNSIFIKDNNKYYFHVIMCKHNDEYSKEQFSLLYEYLFKSIDEPKSDFDIETLINSLEDLFKITEEKDLIKLHTGVFGELLFVNYAYDMGCSQILTKYHKKFYSKHDLELDKNNRIEIKSSLSQNRIHTFSHDQIYRKDVKVYVVSILLEESSEGVTLYELFEKLINKSSDSDIVFWLSKLKGFCGISHENVGPSFAYQKALNELKVFDAESLPHLTLDNVKGISNISYDVNCSTCDDINFNDFIKIINNLILKG